MQFFHVILHFSLYNCTRNSVMLTFEYCVDKLKTWANSISTYQAQQGIPLTYPLSTQSHSH